MLLAFLVLAQFSVPVSLEAGIRKAIAPLHGAIVREEEGELTARYHMESARVPPADKTGRLIKTEPQERPALDGFELDCYEFAHRPGEPARPEQVVRMAPNYLRAYKTWKFDAVERQVKGTARARYYYLAWGNNVNPRVLQRIRAALEAGTVAIPSKP